jgi:hypothetical protein
MPPAAGCPEQAPAIPAARYRLQRIAHQLSHEKNFDHRKIPAQDAYRPQNE